MAQLLQAFRKVVRKHQTGSGDIYAHLIDILVEEDVRPFSQIEKYVLARVALLGPSAKYPLAWQWATHTVKREGSSFREHADAWNRAYDACSKTIHHLTVSGLLRQERDLYAIVED